MNKVFFRCLAFLISSTIFTAANAASLDSAFIGEWTAITATCVAGSVLEISADKIDDEAAGPESLDYRFLRSESDKTSWIEIYDKQKKRPSRVLGLKVIGDEMIVSPRDSVPAIGTRIDTEDLGQQCWYRHKAKKKKDKKISAPKAKTSPSEKSLQ